MTVQDTCPVPHYSLLCCGWGRGSEGKINMPNVTAQTLLFAIENTINQTLISENRLSLPTALWQTLAVSTITFSPRKYFSLTSKDVLKCSYKNSSEVSFGSGNSWYSTHQNCTFQIMGWWHLVFFCSG